MMQSAMADPALPLTIESVDMELVPDIVSIPANVEAQLLVTNHGKLQHSLRAGEYKMFCDMKGHAEAGMGAAIVAR